MVEGGEVRALFFGTYDEGRHPRVRAIRQGLESRGWTVSTLNRPLADTTDRRIAAARGPMAALSWIRRLAGQWRVLWREARSIGIAPDVVVIGYLGVFDILLAWCLFRESLLVLDHLAPVAETLADRELGRLPQLLGRLVDWAGIRCADVVMVDTKEHMEALTSGRAKAVLVPLGAPVEWFGVPTPSHHHALSVVFFGTHTPLQGTPTIGEAISLLRDDPISFTMIGTGQDYDECRRFAATSNRVQWIDWVDAADLPGIVAEHSVCLGVFGARTKTQIVVPNKVVQGVAASRAVVTAVSSPVSRRLGDSVLYVPPADPSALANAIRDLAASEARVEELQRRAYVAGEQLRPSSTVQDLLGRLPGGRESRM